MTRSSKKGPFHASWDSLAAFQVPKWYRDAKFGIFIHWGAYSVPAFDSEWYPRNMYIEGGKVFTHHLETHGPPSKFAYEDFIPKFTAEKFDANHWAKIFRKAGAKFVVPVAEHHDGFPMYVRSLLLQPGRAMEERRRDQLPVGVVPKEGGCPGHRARAARRKARVILVDRYGDR